MKVIGALLFATLISISSVAFAQGTTVSTASRGSTAGEPITVYDPDTAIHPFRLVGLVLRPPAALLQVFVRGFYNAIDTEPVSRAFNIEYDRRIVIDEDY
ncbi:MAG TPA: hypothetical protein VHT73_14695 [Thermodesulfobacteriota bacterium]|nr:hypothetical protein [Thermodesulfobacteriota bacterium]